MNIKAASEKTGLTKKAIKYYESEGLINPLKNNDNNYREYTNDDIVKLNLIGALRAIDIPTSEIKCLVEGNKKLQDVMKDALNKINETISNLEKSKIVISSIINKDLQDYSIIGEQVKKLRETLEFSIAEKEEFISTTLLRIFPGNFGEIFVSIYKPFLNITIDSDAKKDAWLKFVEFLDDLNEVDDNHPLIKGMSNLEVYKIEEYKEKLNNSTLNFLSNDALIKEKYKEGIISFLKSINENEEIRKKFSESIAQAKDMLNVIGASNNTFDEYLEMLNEDYKKYREAGREKIKEIDEEIKSQFGFTWTEFLENSVTISK